MNDLRDYYDALNRLIEGTPTRVPVGSKINNDTVAQEAGRKRGSIKRSRVGFCDLISQIKKASSNQRSDGSITTTQTIKRLKSVIKGLREKYHQSLNREVMLLNRLSELEKELQKHQKVIPFRR